jgi:hypothetical protein
MAAATEPAVPELKNYPPPPSRSNPASRASDRLSPWRAGPLQDPTLPGALCSIRRMSALQERLLAECLELAGDDAIDVITSAVRRIYPPHVLATPIINTILAYEVNAYEHRVQDDRLIRVNVRQREKYWIDALQDYWPELYSLIGRRVTSYVYSFMWNTIAATAGWPRECINTGDFGTTNRIYERLGSVSEYYAAGRRALEGTLKVICFMILKHSAPDFEPASALDVRLGTSANPIPFLMSAMDKAGECGHLDRAEDLARQLGIGNKSQTKPSRYEVDLPVESTTEESASDVERWCARQDRRSIFHALEISFERRWWDVPAQKLVPYFNRALRNHSLELRNNDCHESDAARRAGKTLISLDAPGNIGPGADGLHQSIGETISSASGRYWPEEIMVRADIDRICDLEGVPDDVRAIIRERYDANDPEWGTLADRLGSKRIRAAKQRLKPTETWGRKLAQSPAMVGFSGKNRTPSGYANTPSTSIRQDVEHSQGFTRPIVTRKYKSAPGRDIGKDRLQIPQDPDAGIID